MTRLRCRRKQSVNAVSRAMSPKRFIIHYRPPNQRCRRCLLPTYEYSSFVYVSEFMFVWKIHATSDTVEYEIVTSLLAYETAARLVLHLELLKRPYNHKRPIRVSSLWLLIRKIFPMLYVVGFLTKGR